METTLKSWTESSILRRAIEIERLDGVDPARFYARFVQGEGKPAVVTDAMDDWQATSRWTFEFFKDRYGDDEIIANSPFFLEHVEGLSPVQVRLKLRDYIDYVEKPSGRVKGEFLQGTARQLKANGIPLYAPCYRVLGLHPELYSDLEPSPYFVDDLLPHFPESFVEFLDKHLQPVHFLFFTPERTKAFLHQDYWGTHAYLAQMKGTKLAVLFSPGDSERIYRGEVRDPLWVDEQKFPRFEAATPHIAVLEPGDTLFIPSMWWHYVLCLKPSITFSRDFVNLSNCRLYLTWYLETMLKLIATMPDEKSDLFYQTYVRLYRGAKAEREELASQFCSPQAKV